MKTKGAVDLNETLCVGFLLYNGKSYLELSVAFDWG